MGRLAGEGGRERQIDRGEKKKENGKSIYHNTSNVRNMISNGMAVPPTLPENLSQSQGYRCLIRSCMNICISIAPNSHPPHWDKDEDTHTTHSHSNSPLSSAEPYMISSVQGLEWTAGWSGGSVHSWHLCVKSLMGFWQYPQLAPSAMMEWTRMNFIPSLPTGLVRCLHPNLAYPDETRWRIFFSQHLCRLVSACLTCMCTARTKIVAHAC